MAGNYRPLDSYLTGGNLTLPLAIWYVIQPCDQRHQGTVGIIGPTLSPGRGPSAATGLISVAAAGRRWPDTGSRYWPDRTPKRRWRSTCNRNRMRQARSGRRPPTLLSFPWASHWHPTHPDVDDGHRSITVGMASGKHRSIGPGDAHKHTHTTAAAAIRRLWQSNSTAASRSTSPPLS